MKKVLFIMLFTALSITSANAQFEKGRTTLSANTSGLDLGLSGVDGLKNFDFDLGVRGSYFFIDNLAAMAGVGLSIESPDGGSSYTGFSFQVGAKYHFLDALYGGLTYNGITGTDMDLASFAQIEAGYTYHISKAVFFEPALYYQIGLGDMMKKYGRLGLSLGIGIRL